MTVARRSHNEKSEYLAQRREGRKEIELPGLAFLASWREKSPFWIATGHGKFAQAAKIFKYSNATVLSCSVRTCC
jgi:hypothetical protein